MAFDGKKLGEEFVVVVRDFVTRSIAPLKDRISALESDDPPAARAKQAETVASLERRASRQAEHLAALESRLKRLEHRGDE